MWWLDFIQELIENLARNELSSEDYPCLNDPSPSYHGSPFAGPVNQNPHSMRSRRTPTWARPRGSEDGYSRFSFLSSLVPSNLIASDEISLFFLLSLWWVIIPLTSELCRNLFKLAIIVDILLENTRLCWNCQSWGDFLTCKFYIFLMSHSDSVIRHASSDFRRVGQRIFVFIVGGATRSEVWFEYKLSLYNSMSTPTPCPSDFLVWCVYNLNPQLRVCHKLTEKLKREIILGSSSIDDPAQFITVLKFLPFLM